MTEGSSAELKLRGVLSMNVRRLRSVGRLSQKQLAVKAGLNCNYVGMIERQENAATIDVIARLAAAFGVEPAVLLRDDEEG